MKAAREISWELARRLRLRSLRLDANGQTASDVESVAAHLCGVQAQDAKAAALGVRVRSTGLTERDVGKAMFEDRTVVRTWLMRETLHLVPAVDLHWMLSLFGARNVAASVRRATGLGITREMGQKGLKAIRRTVAAKGPSTRAELTKALEKAGVPADPLRRVQMHLIRRAGSQGIICEVAPKKGAQAFGLLTDWVPASEELDRLQALENLARRYLTAFQPASEQDFAGWSGLSLGELRVGLKRIEGETAEVSIDGKPAWMLRKDLPAGANGRPGPAPLRLLPAFDAYILGYRSRDFAIPPAGLRSIWPGGGVIRPTVITDGRAVATWKVVRSKTEASVQVEPFNPGAALSSRPKGIPQRALQAEKTDVGRFLQVPVG